MPGTHPSTNRNFFSFSWRVFQKVSLMIFVNDNSRHSSEKTRFSLQVCVPYLIRKQNDEWSRQRNTNWILLFLVIEKQMKNSKHLCVSYQFTMRKENYEQDTSITYWKLMIKWKPITFIYSSVYVISFMDILPVHKTMAAVRYGSLSLLFTKKNVLLCKSSTHI